MKLSDAEFASLLFEEQGSDPSTPASGRWRAYVKSDGFYLIDDTGAVSGPFSTASGLAAHIGDTSDAHDASAISILDTAGDFTATDVEGALAELQAADEADEAALAAHIADTGDAHDASAISVVDTGGYFTGTDVEAALQELGAAAGGGGGAVDPLEIYSTAVSNALNDEFETDTVDGAWVNVAPTGTVVWTQKRHRVTVKATVDVAASDLACHLKAGTLAVGDALETMIDMLAPYAVSTGALLLLTDGTGTTAVPLGCGLYYSSSGPALWQMNGGTIDSYGGSTTLVNFNLRIPVKVRIRRVTSTTYATEYSMDGYTWSTMDLSSPLTSSTTFTHVGFAFTNVAGTNNGHVGFEYIRKYAA